MTHDDDKEPPVPATQPGYNAFRPVTAGRRLNTPAQQPPAPAAASSRPATAQEAEARFWRRYGPQLLTAFVGEFETPISIDGWYNLADQLRDVLDAAPLVREAILLERLAEALRLKATEE